MPSMDDTTETAEEIVSLSPVPGVTKDELNRIRIMRAFRNPEYSQKDMERIISGLRGREYTGGTVHRHVKAALEYLDNEHTEYNGEGIA